MIGLRGLLSKRGVVALAATCALQCAWEVNAQPVSPSPGKALVVMYRADRQAVTDRVPVVANADRLGNIGNGEYVSTSVNPGRTFLRAGDRVLTTLALQTVQNQTYYVLIEAVAGSNPVQVNMREVPAANARDALARSRPASSAPRAPLAAAPAAAAAPLARPATPATAAAPAPAPARPAPAAAPPPPQRQAVQPPPPKPAPAAVAEPEDEGEEVDERHWKPVVIAKTGAFNLGTTTQPIGGQPTSFKKGSKPVAGVELEFRNRDGLAFGGEFFYYKNDISLVGSTLHGEQEVMAAMLNAKYYFAAKRWLYPFVGIGGGVASAKFGGDLGGKMSGHAYQLMVGADVRFSNTVGLYLEYKFLNSNASDNTGQSLDIGGSGILAGLSFIF